MDSDSGDSSQCMSIDSGFFDDVLVIDGASSDESEMDLNTGGFATNFPPNDPASASAAPDADLAEDRNNVLRELLEQVPEVELPWFLDHALPKLDPEVNIASLVEQMKQNGLINDQGFWSLWNDHPISNLGVKENVVYSPFQTLAANICEQSGLKNIRKQTVAFLCIPDQPPTQEMRSNTSKPDCAAVLLKPDGSPVWTYRPKPRRKPKGSSQTAAKTKAGSSTSQTPEDASAPQPKPPSSEEAEKAKKKEKKTEEEKQKLRRERKERKEREREHVLRWMDMAVPGEFKVDARNPRYTHDNQKKILWSLAYVLREDPRRRFVHGFTIEDTNMRLWFCSRSDVFVSKPFDFMKDHELTVRFILSICFASLSQLGWDSTIKVVPESLGTDSVKFDIQVRDHETGDLRTFRTRRVLSNIGADVVRGRGTRVWEVYELDQNGQIIMKTVLVDGKPIQVPVLYALKDCWIDDNRWLEGEIIDMVCHGKANEDDSDKEEKQETDQEKHDREELNQFLMHYVAHGRVYVGDQPDHTRTVMLDSQELPKQSSVLHVPLEYSARTQVVSKLPAIGSMALAREAPQAMHLYSGKFHYRIVYEEVGETLFSVKSMSDVFWHLAGVTQGIGLLYSQGWMHRDISVGNILIVNGSPKISDLEYAKPVVNDSKPHSIRTGTIFFMSTEVHSHGYQYWRPPVESPVAKVKRSWAKKLSKEAQPVTPSPAPKASSIADIPFRHNVLHDAESIFWLGLYLLLVSILTLPKDAPKAERAKYTEYQKAQHILATKIFCHNSFRVQAMLVHSHLLRQANLLSLHPRIREAIDVLERIRAAIVRTFEEAERDLHLKPHDVDLDGVDGLLGTMVEEFLRLFHSLRKNDIAVKPRSKVPTKLHNAVKGDNSKRKPQEQPDEDEGNPSKRVRTEDGPVASTSSTGLSGRGVPITVDSDFFGRSLDAEVPSSVASSSRASSSGVPSSRVSSSQTSDSGASSSRAPIAEVEKTPKKPKRTNKGKGVARE